MAKQSSNALSQLASRILKGAQATQREMMQLAASVLSQDETRGARQTKTAGRTGTAKKRKAGSTGRKGTTRKSMTTRRAAKKRK
jgi:hypothetical protein